MNKAQHNKVLHLKKKDISIRQNSKKRTGGTSTLDSRVHVLTVLTPRPGPPAAELNGFLLCCVRIVRRPLWAQTPTKTAENLKSLSLLAAAPCCISCHPVCTKKRKTPIHASQSSTTQTPPPHRFAVEPVTFLSLPTAFEVPIQSHGALFQQEAASEAPRRAAIR